MVATLFAIARWWYMYVFFLRLFGAWCSVKFFSKLNKFIFGYFDPKNIFFSIIKINNFWGDFSDISAETATLMMFNTPARFWAPELCQPYRGNRRYLKSDTNWQPKLCDFKRHTCMLVRSPRRVTCTSRFIPQVTMYRITVSKNMCNEFENNITDSNNLNQKPHGMQF